MKPFAQIEKNNGQLSLFEVGRQYGKPQSKSQIIPGRFYLFKIQSPVPALTETLVPQISGGREYYDLSPVGLLLFHENWQQTALVLNLKIMPAPISAKLLEAYYFLSQQNGLASIYEGEQLLPLEQRRLLDKRFYLFPPGLLAQAIGANNLNYAINKYKMEDVLQASLIDFDQFGKLVAPRFSPIGLFPETLNVESVFENFIQKSF